MRRRHSSKDAVYNSFAFFAHQMGLPFGKAEDVRKYLEDQKRKIFLALPGRATVVGKTTRKELKKRLDSYPHTGHLGSHDPILPGKTNRAHEALASNKHDMCEKWKKDNLYKRYKTFDIVRQPYNPTRRADGIGA